MTKEVKEIANSIENMPNKLREVWYEDGFRDGYNKAMSKLAVEKGSADEPKSPRRER